jgi:hypothetical protein
MTDVSELRPRAADTASLVAGGSRVLWAPVVARVLPLATWLALGASSGLTLALYWRVLGFSYFLDDAHDLTLTEQTSYWDLLVRPAPGSIYYRPLPYMIFKTVNLIFGSYNTVVLHAIPMLFHAISGWLVYLLVRRVTGSLWSLLSATLFLLYPFSYQSVAILGTLVHTLVTVQILAVLLLWYDDRTMRSPGRLAAAAFLSLTALWSHEYGIVLAPLLAGMEGVLWWRGQVRRPTAWLSIPVTAEVLYLYLWFTLDKPHRDYVSTADRFNSAALWLQDFAFPIARQARWLAGVAGGAPVNTVLWFAGAGVLLALLLYRRAGRLRWGLLLLVAGAVAFIPALATLNYEYVQNGPRLLYVVAPASAAFWGLLPMLRFRDQALTRAWRACALVFLGVVAVQSVLFINKRLVMFEHSTHVAEGVISAGARHDGGRVLLLNIPSWFSVRGQEFPEATSGCRSSRAT